MSSRNCLFRNSIEFVTTHSFVCLERSFSRKTAHCADSWTACWPLPFSPSWFHHLHCLFSITQCWHLCHALTFFPPALTDTIFCSPPFLPSFPPVTPPLPPAPPSPSTPLSCCRTPPMMEQTSAQLDSVSHARTLTHAHVNTHAVVSLCSTHYWIVFFVGFFPLWFVFCVVSFDTSCIITLQESGLSFTYEYTFFSTSAQNIASENVWQFSSSSLATVWTITHKHIKVFCLFLTKIFQELWNNSIGMHLDRGADLSLSFCKTERDKLEGEMRWNFEVSRW